MVFAQLIRPARIFHISDDDVDDDDVGYKDIDYDDMMML